MTRYCVEIKEISGTTGDEYVATGYLDPNDPTRQSLRVGMGSVVKIATELPLLVIGNHTFRKIRLCKDELAGYLNKGETVCIHVFPHMWRKLIVIGVQSQNGPSSTMSFGRMLTMVFTPMQPSGR